MHGSGGLVRWAACERRSPAGARSSSSRAGLPWCCAQRQGSAEAEAAAQHLTASRKRLSVSIFATTSESLGERACSLVPSSAVKGGECSSASFSCKQGRQQRGAMVGGGEKDAAGAALVRRQHQVRGTGSSGGGAATTRLEEGRAAATAQQQRQHQVAGTGIPVGWQRQRPGRWQLPWCPWAGC